MRADDLRRDPSQMKYCTLHCTCGCGEDEIIDTDEYRFHPEFIPDVCIDCGQVIDYELEVI